MNKHNILDKSEVRLETEESSQNSNEIYGIDIKEGISRVVGNVELYNEILGDYYEENINLISTIRISIENKEYTKAKQLVHSLKGISANLSINTVSELSKELETQIFKNNNSNLDLYINKLEQELCKVLEAILHYLHKIGKPVKSNSNEEHTFNQREVEAKIKELNTVLNTKDFAASDKAKELQNLLNNTKYHDQINDILHHTNKLEFKNALKLLTALCKKLNISLS